MSTSGQIYNFQFLGSLDSAYILRVALAISYGCGRNYTDITSKLKPRKLCKYIVLTDSLPFNTKCVVLNIIM